MKKLAGWAVGLLASGVILFSAIGTFYASPFFDFNKETIIASGYADNLWLIQNSPGEFTTEDIIWMIDNDCLDMAGAKWCVSAGLIPEDALERPALSENKDKPQSVFDGSQDSTPQESAEPEKGQTESPKEPEETEKPSENEEIPQGTADNEGSNTSSSNDESAGNAGSYVSEPVNNTEILQNQNPESNRTGNIKNAQNKSEQNEEDPVAEQERTAAYGHFYDNLDNTAKAAYSYFKAKGSNCFIQVLSTAPDKQIEGKYLASQTSSDGEIRFSTDSGQILYSYIFRNPEIGEDDTIDLSLSLIKEDSGSDFVESYKLILGSGYPQGVSVKVLVDRINQKYDVYDGQNKIGTYTSDYSGYLEIPVREDEYTVSCDVFIGKTEADHEMRETTEILQELEPAQEKPESVNYLMFLVPVCVVVAVLTIVLAIYLKKKTRWN